MTDISTIEPAFFIAGDTVRWRKSLSDYLASDGWSLNYRLIGPESIDIAASSDGDDHLVDLAMSETASYTAGDYVWQSYVTNGTERHTIGTGSISITADFNDISGTHDGRAHVKKVLDALEATIEGRATTDQSSYSIGNRSLSRMDISELLDWRDKYRIECQRLLNKEKIARGEQPSGKIGVRFK